MINYKEFLNQEILNTNNESGIIISCDQDQIVVQYQTLQKTYNPEIAFKSGFLSFKDKTTQQTLEKRFLENQQQLNKKEQAITKKTTQYLDKCSFINAVLPRIARKMGWRITRSGMVITKDGKSHPITDFLKKTTIEI